VPGGLVSFSGISGAVTGGVVLGVAMLREGLGRAEEMGAVRRAVASSGPEGTGLVATGRSEVTAAAMVAEVVEEAGVSVAIVVVAAVAEVGSVAVEEVVGSVWKVMSETGGVQAGAGVATDGKENGESSVEGVVAPTAVRTGELPMFKSSSAISDSRF